MAVDFSRTSWADEIADITEQEEFQGCRIRIVDLTSAVMEVDTDDGETTWTGEEVHYEGQARFIPVRAGVYHGGEGQLNAATIRSGRIQLPRTQKATRIGTGWSVFFLSVPGNPNLENRMATVNDDFQGSAAATRTFHVTLDSDGVIGNG